MIDVFFLITQATAVPQTEAAELTWSMRRTSPDAVDLFGWGGVGTRRTAAPRLSFESGGAHAAAGGGWGGGAPASLLSPLPPSLRSAQPARRERGEADEGIRLLPKTSIYAIETFHWTKLSYIPHR